MRPTPLALALAGLLAGPLAALAPAPSRAAELWGLENEKIATFPAKVVDLLCEVGGPPCPPDCGGGRRQLGLLDAEGKLRAAVKGAFEFAGPSADLLPYCGKTIQVDGLLVENPRMTMMFVQAIRETDSQPWQPTEGFRKAWEAKNGDPQDWVRKDPQVKAIIAADGVFGIPGLKSKSPDVTNPALKAP